MQCRVRDPKSQEAILRAEIRHMQVNRACAPKQFRLAFVKLVSLVSALPVLLCVFFFCPSISEVVVFFSSLFRISRLRLGGVGERK